MRALFFRAGLWAIVLIIASAAVVSLLSSCSSRRPSRPYIETPPKSPSVTPAPAKGARHVPPAAPTVIQKPLRISSTPRNVIHEVAPMETVWRLSKTYDVPMESIYAANGLEPGDPILIGQKLVIPGASVFTNVIPLYPEARWRYIIIHHTGTEVGKALLIHNNHRTRGFDRGLGYHFLIDNGTLEKGDGQIEVARRWIKQQDGAHCKAAGMNQKGIGIGVVGNFNAGPPSINQMKSLALLVNALSNYYSIPRRHILGHGHVRGANTDCPGKRFPWRSFLNKLKRR